MMVKVVHDRYDYGNRVGVIDDKDENNNGEMVRVMRLTGWSD
jgi:hypothetical protein